MCESRGLEPGFWGKRGSPRENLWRTLLRLPAFTRRPPHPPGHGRTDSGGLGRNPVPHGGTAPGETLWKSKRVSDFSSRRRQLRAERTHRRLLRDWKGAMLRRNRSLSVGQRVLPGGARDPLRSVQPSKAPGPSQWVKCPCLLRPRGASLGAPSKPSDCAMVEFLGPRSRPAGSWSSALCAPTPRGFKPSSARTSPRSATASASTGS